MRSKVKGYRRIDENILVNRLPIPTNALCQQCGGDTQQIRHHISDDKGVIYVWNVCKSCNTLLKQKGISAKPIWIIHDFYKHTQSCAVCGLTAKLIKHHYIQSKDVFVLRVCIPCNNKLPSNGFSNTQQAIKDIHNRIRARRVNIDKFLNNASPNLIPKSEVATILNVHPKTVLHWLQKGLIKGVQLGHGHIWRIYPESLTSFIKRSYQITT